MTTIREELLENGLRLCFTDESNRYFGDYHRLRIVATISCELESLPAESDEDASLRSRSVALFGKVLSVSKPLERMGVAGDEVEKVRSAMMDDFMAHAGSYLSKPDYPQAMVAAELKKRSGKKSYYG